MSDDDDWGDDEGGDGWGDDGDDGDADDDAPLSLTVKIENQFYESESQMREDPEEAVKGFRQCVVLVNELEQKEPENVTDEERTKRFRSLKEIAILLVKTKQEEKIPEVVKDLMKYIDEVTRNDAFYALEAVLSQVGESPKRDVSMKVYELTLEALKAKPGQQQLWFQIAMKLTKDYMSSNEHMRAMNLVNQCHATLQVDGRDDRSKQSQLLEIYAVKMEILTARVQTGDSVEKSVAQDELKACFTMTQSLQSDVSDPKVTSIIQECFGKMHGGEGRWPQAFESFSKAFDAYNSYGDNRLKRVLKYMVISVIMSGSTADVFGERKTKVHERDPEVVPVVMLMSAYKNDRIKEFRRVLEANRRSTLGDPFILAQVEALLLKLRAKYLLKLIEPYSRVRLSWLAQELQATIEETENIVLNLILDKSIKGGKLDQISNILHLTPLKPDPYAKALTDWLQKLGRIRSSLSHRLEDNKPSGKRSGSFGMAFAMADEMD